jgi:hypothetical protein
MHPNPQSMYACMVPSWLPACNHHLIIMHGHMYVCHQRIQSAWGSCVAIHQSIIDRDVYILFISLYGTTSVSKDSLVCIYTHYSCFLYKTKLRKVADPSIHPARSITLPSTGCTLDRIQLNPWHVASILVAIILYIPRAGSTSRLQGPIRQRI